MIYLLKCYRMPASCCRRFATVFSSKISFFGAVLTVGFDAKPSVTTLLDEVRPFAVLAVTVIASANVAYTILTSRTLIALSNDSRIATFCSLVNLPYGRSCWYKGVLRLEDLLR